MKPMKYPMRKKAKRSKNMKKGTGRARPGLPAAEKEMLAPAPRRMKKAGGSLKPVDKEKNPGLAKLPTKVRNKMGYMKDGGRVMKAEGGVANHAQLKGFGAVRPDVKKFGK